MNYLITMEDGSSAYLSHHGVKGMKWGHWNEETAAKYSGDSKKIQRLTGKMLKAEQKMMGDAHREANHPSNWHSAKLADSAGKYVKAKGKLAKAEYKAGKPDDEFGIRKQERDAYDYYRNVSNFGIIGGLASKKKASAYNAVLNRTMRDAREQAKYTKEETEKLLNSVLSGEKEVVGVAFDGKGGSTYITKSNKK